MSLYDRDLIDALARNVIGRPAAACSWRDLLHVRDTIDELLNGAVNAAQNAASTSRPAADGHSGGSPTRRATSGDSFTAETRPAPNLPGVTAPVVAPGSTTTSPTKAAARGRGGITRCP